MAWPVIGAVVGAGLSMFGASQSASRSNDNAERQAELQYEVDKENYDWNWNEEDGQMWRKHAYNQKTVDLQRQNADTSVALQEQQAMDNWSYGMTIRDFEHNERLRIRDQQVKQANQQVGFNEIAFDRGLRQQDNWLQEQELALNFQQIAMDVGWENTQRDSQLQQAGLDNKQRSARAMNQLQIQATSVAGLKAEGQARASGQSGRSAGKSVQAAIAENGAKQAVYSEQTTQAGEQYALSTQQNVNQLNTAFKDLFMQQQQLNATRNSLSKKDMFAREELNLQFQQANADALNKIMINPTLAPDLPKPPDLDLYKPIFQEPFDIEAPPEPKKGVAMTQSVMGAALSAGASGIGSAIGAIPQLTIPKPNIDYGT